MTITNEPILLDSTGRDIVNRLDAANAFLGSIAASQRGESWATNLQTLKTLIASGAQPLPVGGMATFSRATSVNITVGDSTGITGATIDETTFMTAFDEAFDGYLQLTYDSSLWKDGNGKVYALADYGISVTGTADEGDELIIHQVASSIPVDVLGYDHDTLVNPHVAHHMTLCAQDALDIPGLPFCTPQALYYVDAAVFPSGMPAGTYNITLDHGAYNGGTNQDGTYQFTTTIVIPVGGQIQHSTIGKWQANSSYNKAHITNGVFTTYASGAATSALESNIVTTEGSGGTSLGTTTAYYPQYKTSDYLNYSTRNSHGSNRYKDSDLLQWLNSDAPKGAGWWTQKSPWGRVPTNNTTMAGFLAGFSSSFKNALLETHKVVALSAADGGGSEVVTSKIFLMSMAEVYMGSAAATVTLADGREVSDTVYPFFEDFSDLAAPGAGADSNRIKYVNGVARSWRIRNFNGNNSYSVCFVNTQGKNSGYDANYTYTIVPVFNIG